MALDESVRQVATMKVGISTYVATAALAVMAGTLVIFTFVAASFREPWLFHVLVFLGLMLLVLSVYIGGRESGRVTDQIAADDWDPQDTKQGMLGGRFSQQASLTLLGLVVVTVAAITGVSSDPEESRTDERFDHLLSEFRSLELRAASTHKEVEELSREVRRLRARLSR